MNGFEKQAQPLFALAQGVGTLGEALLESLAMVLVAAT